MTKFFSSALLEINDPDKKCESIKSLINELPKPNYDILSLLIPHLRK